MRHRGGLLTQIEAGARNRRTDLVDVLRLCLALGGHAGSESLRDWARLELDGYRGANEEVPDYRRIPVAVLADGIQGNWRFEGKQLSAFDLPDFAQDAYRHAAISFGVAEIERHASGHESVRLSLPGMTDLVYYMNHDANYNASFERLYVSVTTASFHAISEAIRTKLVAIIAEMRAAGVGARQLPSPAVADRAFQVVIKGAKRSNIIVNQALGDGASASLQTTTATVQNSRPDPTASRSRWIRGPWSLAVGVSTILAGVAGVAVWANWFPFGPPN